MDEVTEKDLAEASANGDLEAFNRLVEANEAGVRAFFRVRIFDWSAADDLAQDVFVTAFQRIATFRREARFRAWLRGIATNHLRNYLRQRRDDPVGGGEELQVLLTRQVDLNYEKHFSNDDDLPGEEVLLEALKGCVSEVKGTSRELLDKRYETGQTVREIAAETGRGYSALVMQLLRIRKSLANCIRQRIAQIP